VRPFTKAFKQGKKNVQQNKVKYIKRGEIMKTFVIALLIHRLTSCIFAAAGIYAMKCGFIKIGAFMAICAGISIIFTSFSIDHENGKEDKK
jgi:hypothetical protein